MAKKPDTPCAGGCGKLLWSGGTSLPAGQRRCRDCRRATQFTPTGQRCGRCKHVLSSGTFAPSVRGHAGAWCRPCQAEYARTRSSRSAGRGSSLICDDCGRPTTRGATAYGRFCQHCATARKRTRESRKVSKRRTAQRFTDITAAYERDLRRRTRRCPLCSTWMTGEPGHPNSKQLDHIIPIVLGGTHTIGNVRIICRTCNLSRPKDGSDLAGHQPTLWAQDLAVAEELIGSARQKAIEPERKTCRCGRRLVKGSCKDCPVRMEERRQRAELGREAARMRADGHKWRAISDALGLSGTGTAYALAWQYGDPSVKAIWLRDCGWTLEEVA